MSQCSKIGGLYFKDLGALSLAGGEVSLMNDQGLALLRVGSLYGEYYEATDDKGNLLGFTMWMPPGQEMFSTLVSPNLISIVETS